MNDETAQRNIKLVVAYNGANYHGWQRQTRDLDTVQQRIEDALTKVMKHPVTLTGAGRTDAGVHAEGQCANFRTPNLNIPLKGLRRATNSRLPGDNVVRSANEVPMDFHASISAVGKTYRYRIYVAPTRPVQEIQRVLYYWRSLDVERMREAGRRIVGTRDFRAFTISAEQRENTVRTVRRCEVSEHGPEIHITVEGDGFLYNMVRIIVGTLIEVGRNHWTPERVTDILKSRDRGQAGPTAAASGLAMVCVHYPQ